MNPGDKTLAALLTPLAPGAIAVIKLIGDSGEQILQGICRSINGDQSPTFSLDVPRHCRIIDDNDQLDEAIVVVTRTGAGVTAAELHTHGGVRVVQRVMELLSTRGAEIVSARELNDSASGDGQIERIIDAHLINAKSVRLANWLLAQREILPAFLRDYEKLDDQQRAEFENRSRIAKRLLEGIHIAIIGPPNAGKSTLANCLIGHDRVITSDVPGTTRDWVSETALIEGWPVTLTDTAGIRATSCEIEREAIRRGSEQVKKADLVLIVIDGLLEQALQLRQLSELQERLDFDQEFLVIQNKADPYDMDWVRLYGEIRVEALNERGIMELESAVAKKVKLDQLKDDLPTDVRNSSQI